MPVKNENRQKLGSIENSSRQKTTVKNECRQKLGSIENSSRQIKNPLKMPVKKWPLKRMPLKNRFDRKHFLSKNARQKMPVKKMPVKNKCRQKLGSIENSSRQIKNPLKMPVKNGR